MNRERIKKHFVSAFFLLAIPYALYEMWSAIAYGEVRIRGGRWISFADRPGRFVFDLVASIVMLLLGIFWFLNIWDTAKSDRHMKKHLRNQPEFERPEFIARDTSNRTDANDPRPPVSKS